ncbi:MAG TPA: hypothetical protein VII72_06075 [Myxococcota bacterium]
MTQDGDFALSLVRGDALLRLQRRIGMVPEAGLGVARRALALATITWLPIAVWAALYGRALSSPAGEPLLNHFGVQVRCLVAIPLFVIAEGVAHSLTTRLIPHFVRSGLVSEADRPRLREVLTSVAKLRDRVLPWALILGMAVAVQAIQSGESHELVWAGDAAAPASLGFGGWWFAWVARPVFLALLFGWLWRLVLLCVLFRRIAGLDLALVPTHPDGAGGLGFLEAAPAMFSPVVFGISAVLASRWAHDVLYHAVHVDTLRLQMIAVVVLALLLFLTPLLLWSAPLRACKRRALLDYGTLVGEHGRLVRRRWILREPVGDAALLGAPEIGPVADTITLYETVRKMRTIPIGRSTLLVIVLAAGLPMLSVLAIEIPIRDLLLKLVKSLV